MLIVETDESFVGNVESGSPTDDDFQPAKKRFRTPGQQVWIPQYYYEKQQL